MARAVDSKNKKRDEGLRAIDRALDRGLAAANRGETVPANQMFDRLKAKYRRMAKSKR